MDYDFRKIEQEWQKRWKANKVYKVPDDLSKPKCYVLDMFPYPSGAGLHVGHPLGYIASDIYSRYKRLKGFNVLHPMGFDSFGLPAEQYALETGQHPAETTKKNIATFKSQLDKIGFCFDWDREVQTSDPNYYKWTQWIFLQLFNSYYDKSANKAKPISELIRIFQTEGNHRRPTTNDQPFTADEWNAFSKKEQEDILMKRRLVFSAYGEVNWCEALGTVLANDEVVNGVSERGGYPVEKKKMRQWFLRITEYADRLLEGLEKVEFSDAMKEMQKNWIGKSEGAEVLFPIPSLIPTPSPQVEKGDVPSSPSLLHEVEKGDAENGAKIEAGRDPLVSHSNKENIASSEFSHPSPRSGEGLGVRVYTTRPDTIFGVDFMVLAPEHELVAQITSAEQKTEIENYLAYVKSRSERERLAEAKTITGCFTGAYAINPFDKREIPIWIAEYVLAGYGTGAIMAVPCGDQRDFGFAKHFNIPITNIIGKHYNGEEANPTKEAILENSGFLDGLLMKDAIGIAVNKMEELGIGKRKVNYKMRDAGFSRQRYWGEPFPIIWSDGIAIPLDAEELPLELPHVDKYGPGPDGEGPLANLTEWVNLKSDLTPNPSPKERGTQDEEHAGYVNSTKDEWKSTIAFAKENRKNLTEAEAIMWNELRNRKLASFKFRRQHPIAGYIPDFVCIEKKLIIEIDGEYHDEKGQKEFDAGREDWLKENGFFMLRFTNNEVLTNINDVLKSIENTLLEEEAKIETGSHSPLPGRGAGGEVKRETSTMPGYAGSSWYFLRYMDPHNRETFCDRKLSDYWNQVDLYIGGTEHAVGHLLYSRMWTKVLFDLGLIGFDEPYKKLLNQGMIQGSSRFVYRARGANVFYSSNRVKGPLTTEELKDEEIVSSQHLWIDALHVDVNIVDGIELDIEAFKKWKPEFADPKFVLDNGKYICGVETEKMSKSKYNTIDPTILCEQYGADTFRMYEMFLGPVEASKPWDTKGIEGVHRFLRKLWRLFNDEIKGRVWNEDKATDAELKVLHRTIKKIEEDTERFSFNTAVSTFMICVNELADLKCNKKEILQPLLILLAPYAPHISEELYKQLNASEASPPAGGGGLEGASFPSFDPALLVESSKEYPVSINGKLRTNITLALDLDQKQVEEIVLRNDIVQKWLEGGQPKKIIFVKNKMINVVI